MQPSVLDEETSKEVLRQVEFYFSDSNLPRDKFMRSTIQSSEDGLVALDLICSFKRMKGHLKLDVSKAEEIPESTLMAVADTLRNSNFLKVSEDGKKVGRLVAFYNSNDVIEQLDARTVAVSPLKYDVKLEDVESYFGKFAKVSSVRLPRHIADKKLFCGTALVEFSTEKDAENALNHEFVYDGLQLEVHTKKDFDVERSNQEQETGGSCGSLSRGINGNESYYTKGLIVAFSLKRITPDSAAKEVEKEIRETNDHDAPKLTIAEAPNTVETDDVMNNPDHSGDSKAEHEVKSNEMSSDAAEKDALKGKKVNVGDLKTNMDVVLREDLRAVLQKYGSVKFIDFKIGEESGYVRFEKPDAAQKVRAAAVLAKDGGLIVKNFIATFEPVTGEAEKDYWKLLSGNQVSYRKNKAGRGRGGNHHGGWNKQTRGKDREANNRPNKVQKVGA